MKTANQFKLLLRLRKLENNGDVSDRDKVLEGIEKKLDPSVLRRYRKFKDKTGSAVAVLVDMICSECKMVYPESHEMLRYKNCVHSCEYCGRLLIVTDKSA
jgi:predicted  nucleic acid-binding Zn-ribbon protein